MCIRDSYYGIPADIRKHALTFLDERLLQILIEFENKYTPVMERHMRNLPIPVKRDETRKVSGEDRATLIENAVQAAEEDVRSTEAETEETTSKKLFNHLFEACNILRGPINQDEYKSYATPILFFRCV